MCWPDKCASWACVKCKAINGRITAAHSTHRLHCTGYLMSASPVSLFTSSDMLLAQVSSHQSRRGISQMHRGVCCIPMNSLPPFHFLHSLVGNDNRFMLQFLCKADSVAISFLPAYKKMTCLMISSFDSFFCIPLQVLFLM